MGSYTQWRTGVDAGEIRRATWVCGEQRVLVEEVVDTVRQALRPSELDYVSLSADYSTLDRDLWAAANQYPLNPGSNRLVLVRDAERVSRWEPLPLWLANTRQLPGVYLLFVSNELDVPYVSGNKRAGLKPHVEMLKAPRGSVVRCAMPNERDAIAWVRRRAHHLSEDTAGYLLTRTGGNLAAVAGVCAKLNLFDGQAGRTTIDQLCAAIPGDSFVDCLLALRKKEALTCIAALTDQDAGKVIGLLDSRLDVLGVLWRAQAAGQVLRDIVGVNPFLARQYLPIARHYDARRCVYNRRVLAVVDDALRSGARDGVWEALVALW